MTGGTLDLNGDDNQNNFPAPDGFGVITNTSPYARAVLKMGLSGGATRTFSGVIQNGNGGAMTTSIVPNSNDGVVPVVYKQGYRMDIDMAAFGDSETLVLAGANTYGGFTRIGGGKLTFLPGGRWGVPVSTGDPITSSPNGTIICNGGIGNLRVDFNGTNQVTGGLSGSGGIFANNADGTCSILTVGAANISNTVWPTGGSGQNGKIVDTTIIGGTGVVALIKTGAGTIGLPTAHNTYSGFTMINNGILEFTANGAPSPNSDHQINSPGVLKLSYTGTRNINGLYLNGVKMGAGTYGAASNPAFFQGGGTVTVVQVHPSVPTILIPSRSGIDFMIEWSGCGMFQQSTDLVNWTNILGAVAPYSVPISGPKKFFRVRY